MTARPVAVRAVAPITPVGIGADAFADALREERAGLDEIVGFDASSFAVQIAGEVQDFELEDYVASVKSYVDRASAFAMAASAMALEAAGWQPDDAAPVGLVLGTEWGCLESMQLYAQKITTSDPKFAPPFLFTQGYVNPPNSLVSIEFGLRGFSACLCCGRTSGAAAIAYAFDQVRHGRADRLLAGGVEALSHVLCSSQDGKAWAPLGEGIGLLALEAGGEGDAVRVLGAGQAAGDEGIARAFAAALDEAGLTARDLGAVFAAAEPAAMGRLKLGAGPPQFAPGVQVIWLDPRLGDTMGASGAIASCAATLMIDRDIPPQPRYAAVVSADLKGSAVALVLGRPSG